MTQNVSNWVEFKNKVTLTSPEYTRFHDMFSTFELITFEFHFELKSKLIRVFSEFQRLKVSYDSYHILKVKIK